MIRIIYFLAAGLFALQPLRAQEARLMRYPDISNDGTIVFTYEDDLWLVKPGQTAAQRLTSHPGKETQASFSPDGNSVAFAGSYDGKNDLYVLSLSDMNPRRITYSTSDIHIMDWSEDGKYIYYTSYLRMNYELYRVPAKGGFSERIPVGKAWQAAIAGKTVVYTPTSADGMNWRGYRGGQQQDLYRTDITGQSAEKLTDWEGFDCRPFFMGSRLFFLSDRKYNRMNLYEMDLKTKTVIPVTRDSVWDVREPGASANAIVFTSGGQLFRYDGKTAERIHVTAASDRWMLRPYTANPDGFISEIFPGNTAGTAYVESRGDLFKIDPESGDPVNLTNTSGSREIQPSLSPDGQWLAFYSDKTGEYELYVMETKAGAPWIQITDGFRTWYYHIVWSPDSKKLLFNDKNYQLYWADVAAKKVTKIDRALYQRDNEIFWEASDYDWSADGKWIAYAKCEFNMNSAIYLYNTENKQTLRLTDDRFDNLSPAFDRNGKYLYFLSNRNFEPELDPLMDNHINVNMTRIMAVQLQDGLPVPFSKEEKETPVEPLKRGIDINNIQKRIFTLPVNPGTYFKLTARENKFFFLSKPRFGFPGEESFSPKTTAIYTLNACNADLAVTRIMEGISVVYNISHDGKQAGYLGSFAGGVVSSESESTMGMGTITWGDTKLTIEPAKEFRQILNDVWLQVRNYFYDPGFQGIPWKAVKDKYSELIPFVTSRQDLNYVLGWMTGELGVSHMYVWRPGDVRRQAAERHSVACLGADLVLDNGAYRFGHIIRTPNDHPDSKNPLLAPNLKLKEGCYLIAINGNDLSPDEDYRKYMVDQSGKKIKLLVNDKASPNGAWTVETEGLFEDYSLRYTEWVETNYQTVKEKSSGRAGYFHLSDCDEAGLRQFEQGFRAERFRDGLIIDVRNNGGGFDSYMMIDKLERKLMYLTQTLDLEPMHYPHGIVRGPMVMICNEGSGSDGDLIALHFKDRKMGTLVGTRTWGGLIGIINFQDLIDGGMVTQVNVGFANLNGEWVVENKGVEPDETVENLPADMEKGVDAQLNRAIEIVLRQIQSNPPLRIKAPAFPKKKW